MPFQTGRKGGEAAEEYEDDDNEGDEKSARRYTASIGNLTTECLFFSISFCNISF